MVVSKKKTETALSPKPEQVKIDQKYESLSALHPERLTPPGKTPRKYRENHGNRV